MLRPSPKRSSRPTMRFVEVKPREQIDLQALAPHARSALSRNRTQLICQIRAFCLEYGVAIRPGYGRCSSSIIARMMADETNDLTPAMRALLEGALGGAQDRSISGLAGHYPGDRRGWLHKHDQCASADDDPGIGPMGATALIAAVGDGRQFRKARDLAAWLGLVPRQTLDRRQDDAPWHEQTRKSAMSGGC